MKTQKIIDFAGMDFHQEQRPALRLKRKARLANSQSRNHVARNVRNLFEQLFGF